jgi:hypothetical protein
LQIEEELMNEPYDLMGQQLTVAPLAMPIIPQLGLELQQLPLEQQQQLQLHLHLPAGLQHALPQVLAQVLTHEQQQQLLQEQQLQQQQGMQQEGVQEQQGVQQQEEEGQEG